MDNPVSRLAAARVVFAVVAFALGAAFALSPHPRDFQLFYYLGSHPRLAYDLNVVYRPDLAVLGDPFAPGELLPFGYPPTFLLLLPILNIAPIVAAKTLWCGGWCAAFVYVASRDTRWATPLLALSIPMLWCLAYAQTGLMVATLIIAAFQRLDERPRLAGVLLAIAACVKPQALLVAPLVLWGRWDVVKAAILTGLALVLASLILGPQLWPQWLANIPKFTAYIEPRYLKVGPSYLFNSLIWRGLLILVGLWFAWRERNVTGLLVGGLLCAPYVQFYDLAGISYLGARQVAKGKAASAVEMVSGVIITICAAWPPLTAAYCAALIGVCLTQA